MNLDQSLRDKKTAVSEDALIYKLKSYTFEINTVRFQGLLTRENTEQTVYNDLRRQVESIYIRENHMQIRLVCFNGPF